LPIILIGQKGQVDVEHAWLKARPHVVLTTPVPIKTLLNAINTLLGGG
jgi:hypothetical protein